MSNVTVHLIGAGPGDPELITVKGQRAIAEANTIIYDYLANPALLAHARADAKLIFVGKKGFSAHITQEQINQCLLDEAAVLAAAGGGSIARLKGGDPFVFGRGGEEAIVLAEAGISFEVVPGVTAGVAAPAFAGIPVTHRGLASSLAFITGNEDPTKEETAIDWAAIAGGAQTLCFYMGIRNLPRITAKLIEHGRPAEQSVALVRWGTMPQQQVLVGTLANIAELAAAAGFEAPAIIVVGDVVQLREQLAWVEKLPLHGLRIAVTRSQPQAGVLGGKLAALGAQVIEMPTIEIEPLSFELPALEQYDWLVFTSANGVEHFFNKLGGDARALAGVRIAAIGPATAHALREYGIKADVVPEEYVAEAVVEALKAAGIAAGDRVLIPRAQEAREVLPQQLRELGVQVDVLPVYVTVASGSGASASAIERLKAGEVDAITFTASSTVKNFLALLGNERAALAGVKLYSIGPVTTQALLDAGLEVTAQAKEYTIPGLVQAILLDAGN
jgi:uroporphyrinogen III methyltransferase/synthase